MKSLSLNQPHLIIMVGVPGSGKSFFAEKFAETFHTPYACLEKFAAFTTDDAGAKELMNYQLDELLKTKQSVLVDGGTDMRTERLDLTRKARAAGYDTLTIWVQTDPVTAQSRSARAARVKHGVTLDAEEYDKLARRFTAPNALEKPVVISGKHTYASQAKVVLKRLSAPRASISTHAKPAARNNQPGRHNITIR